jgi:hypothetical protein
MFGANLLVTHASEWKVLLKMHVHTKLKCCLFTNIILVGCITLLVCISPKVHDTFMRFGPHPDLKLLGIPIDTWSRYWTFQFFLGWFQMTDMLIQELANPIMGFTIYNPDKKIITEFTKNQLQLYAQTFWFLTSIKGALMLLVSITQLDIAISKCVYNELAGVVAIRILLNEKTFKTSNELSEELLPQG